MKVKHSYSFKKQFYKYRLTFQTVNCSYIHAFWFERYWCYRRVAMTFFFSLTYSAEGCDGSVLTVTVIFKRVDTTSLLKNIFSPKNVVAYTLLLADILARSFVEMCNRESPRPFFELSCYWWDRGDCPVFKHRIICRQCRNAEVLSCCTLLMLHMTIFGALGAAIGNCFVLVDGY